MRRGDGHRGRAPRARPLRPGRSSARTSASPTTSASRTSTGRPSTAVRDALEGARHRLRRRRRDQPGPVLRVPRRPARPRRRHPGQPHRPRVDQGKWAGAYARPPAATGSKLVESANDGSPRATVDSVTLRPVWLFASAVVVFVAAAVLALTTLSTWPLVVARVVLIVLGIVFVVVGLRRRSQRRRL